MPPTATCTGQRTARSEKSFSGLELSLTLIIMDAVEKFDPFVELNNLMNQSYNSTYPLTRISTSAAAVGVESNPALN